MVKLYAVQRKSILSDLAMRLAQRLGSVCVLDPAPVRKMTAQPKARYGNRNRVGREVAGGRVAIQQALYHVHCMPIRWIAARMSVSYATVYSNVIRQCIAWETRKYKALAIERAQELINREESMEEEPINTGVDIGVPDGDQTVRQPWPKPKQDACSH